MRDLTNRAHKIIKAAARSHLGLASLIVLLLSIVALTLFTGTKENTRLVAFLLLMIVGIVLFIISVMRVEPTLKQKTKDKERAIKERTQSEDLTQASQAAAVCYRSVNKTIEFLLVKSTGGRWIFPKGDIKEGEEYWARAMKEAQREAGITEFGYIARKALTTFWHRKPDGSGMTVAAFLFEVTSEKNSGEKGRKPKWFSPEAAKEALSKRRRKKAKKELQNVVELACEAIRHTKKNTN